MAIREFFDIPKRYKQWSLGLIAIGVLSVIIGFIVYGTGTEQQQARFWAALLQNSIYFLLITNAAMFFLCATTLAMGGFQMSFRRVTEAISVAVPIIGALTIIIFIAIVLGKQHLIYIWIDKNAVNASPALKGKSGFLNPTFFFVWTFLTIGLWSLLGWKMRKISRELDNNPLPDIEAGKRYIFKNTVWASLYIVWFALTVMSVAPWLWLMSLNSFWASTMFSWYNWASTFVSGCALIAIFVIYLKNQGYLEYTNEEHLHDLGKFMFAFSIFWGYVWFAQYMLIWFANIPEETIYFIPRVTSNHNSGPYSGLFWFMFIINFFVPFLLLMKRGAKRNYTNMTFICIVILFGHWLDYYQMVFASVSPDHVPLNLMDFGIAAGFVGLIMLVVGRMLNKYPMIAKNHPFIKESIIHHT
jgi:hypothetical protein